MARFRKTGSAAQQEKYRKFGTAVSLAALLLGAAPMEAAFAAGDNSTMVVIESQPLEAAVLSLSRQTGAAIYVPSELAEGKTVGAFKGMMKAEDALVQLLADTSLTYRRNSDGSFVITAEVEEDTAKADSAGEASFVLEEIIVTAQKRSQNVQDVPLAISTFSAATMEARGVSSAEDLQFSVPGLTIGVTTYGQAQVTIRGVGSENLVSGGDPGVPMHIDGHYMQAPVYMLRDMLDVERVEVLRGPQGTLYGRNAVGGSVNIITKRPTEELEGKISADVGNYNKLALQGVLSGPLGEGFRGRAAFASEKRGGYITNISNGDDSLQNSDYKSLRVAFEYDLSDTAELYFGGYYYNDHSNPPPKRLGNEFLPSTGVYAGFVTPGTVNISSGNPFLVRNNFHSFGRDRAAGVFVDLDWDLGSVIFRSLSAYNDTGTKLDVDNDGSDLVDSNLHGVTDYETFSQELQLLSNSDSSLSWVFGLFYYEEKSIWDLLLYTADRSVEFGQSGELSSKSYAAFGQVDYAVTEQIELVGGLRYTRDEKEMYRTLFYYVNGGTIIPFSNSTFDDAWEEVTWKLGINYHVNDNMMLYSSWSKGYKAGGFNAGALNAVGYKPEILDAYEAGIKSEWLDRRLQLNMAAFYYDYKDKQEFKIFAEGSGADFSGITNAAAATVKGVEAEMVAIPMTGLTFDMAIGWQDARYDEFLSQDPTRADLGNLDLTGNYLTRAPEWKFHLGGQYEWSVGDMGTVTARVDYAWEDEVFFRAFNADIDRRGSYDRINLRLSWESVGADWKVEAYMLNAENDVTQSNEAVASASFGFGENAKYFDPRTYGIKVTHRF